MRVTFVLSLAIVLLGAVTAQNALAQRGMGDAAGVARQPVKPAIVSLSGKLVEIKTGPCENTTGRAPLGTHIILETEKGDKLNIHLGPAGVVSRMVAKLSKGQPLTVKAFRTEKMPPDQYVAQTLLFGETTLQLRDSTLRPVWAGPGFGGARWADAAEEVGTSDATRVRWGGGARRGGGRGWGGR